MQDRCPGNRQTRHLLQTINSFKNVYDKIIIKFLILEFVEPIIKTTSSSIQKLKKREYMVYITKNFDPQDNVNPVNE